MISLVLFVVFVIQVQCEDVKFLGDFYELDGLIQETVWCGPNNNIILLRTQSSTVYRTEDQGQTFTRITKKMKKAAEIVVDSSTEIGQVTRIVKSDADDSVVVFMGNKGVFWVSEDCGKRMKALSKEFEIGQIKMHPSVPNLMLATAIQNCGDDDLCLFGTHTLYLTEDLGRKWRQIAINVKQFDWVFNNDQILFGVPETRIFALVRTQTKDVLVKSDDYFETRTILVEDCLEYKLRLHKLFALQTFKRDEVHLLVSTVDSRLEHFEKAVFPDIKLKMKNVHILDSSEGVVFLLTTRNPTEPYGRLYVSDASGTKYRLALKNCLRSSVRGADFSKIQGLEGIYIANVVTKEAAKEYERAIGGGNSEEEEWNKEERGDNWNTKTQKNKDLKNIIDNNIKTVITFNKGGSWKYIKAPKISAANKKINCKLEDKCSLNLFLYSNTEVPVYSQKYAYGLILASGNIGKTRNNKRSARNMYLSHDGGLTWIEMAKELYVYDIADHGGLIVMSKLDNNRTSNTSLLYSWNEGATWGTINVTAKESVIEDIFTEPRSISQNFILHLVQSRADEPPRSLVCRLNFEELHQKPCRGIKEPGEKDSDYEYWSPYDGREGEQCLLGKRITYIKKKRDSECYIGDQFNEFEAIEYCPCTKEDYECDFGFYRSEENPQAPCTASINISYSPPEECAAGSNYTVSSGYRKITGDKCRGGITYNPIVLPCPVEVVEAFFTLSFEKAMWLVFVCSVGLLMVTIGYMKKNAEEIRKQFMKMTETHSHKYKNALNNSQRSEVQNKNSPL